MNCGHLERVETEGKPVCYRGEIGLSGVVQGELFLIQNADKRSENSPDWAVKFRPYGAKDALELGAAWTKQMKKGGAFFSITLDGPTLPRATYVQAFPADEQPKHAKPDAPCIMDVIWSRAKKSAPAEMAPATSDGIPY